ncbi:hypothetical protein FJY63_01735 [Candidatus Sumerlaeota bacterium]|nr:hypothetical protein [Candidatus Sumerlaeota bacterium]
MRNVQRLAVWLIAVVMIGASPARDSAKRPKVMPVSELRPGMKGYGLTVFRGVSPERFDVEIVGVLHGEVGAGIDMVLARLEHEQLRDIGVIAGMSGSPIFVDDRLVGAVAYGWSYSKVAIAGITPIERMLEVYERTTLEPPPRDISLGPVEFVRPGEPVSVEPKMRFAANEPVRVRMDDLPPMARALFATEEQEVELRPLSAPIMVSSCSPITANLVKRFFGSVGMEPVFVPMGARATAADSVAATPFVMGTAMGVPMLMGDLSLGSIGTLTYTDGKKIVAFGHPAMMVRGPTELPLGSARIYATLPSVARPFKLGEIVGLGGSIYQDRLTGIGGVIGKVPYMVPMTVQVAHEGSKIERTYRFRMVDNRIFTPRMAMVALTESCVAGERAEGDMTASIAYRVESDDGRVIEKENMVTGSATPLVMALGLLSDLAPIYSNEFQVRSVRSVTARIRLRDGLQSADLRSAFVDRSIVKPGEAIEVSAYIRPWRQPEQRITTTFRIPATVLDGRYNVSVCDGPMREGAEIVRAPGLYKPNNFDDVVRVLKIHFAPNRLYVLLTSAQSGITIGGREFDSLPPSVQQNLNQLRDREQMVPTLGQILAEKTVELPFVLSGSQIVQIQVDRRGGR